MGRALIEERGVTLVPPFDDYEIMAGRGTCGVEICEQLNDMGVVPDAVLINCSGRGLSSGVAEAMKAVFPAIRLYVVEPMGYNKMAVSGVPEKNPPAPKSILEGIPAPPSWVDAEGSASVRRQGQDHFRRRRASCDGNQLSRP